MTRIPKQFALAVVSVVYILVLAACSTSTPVLRYVTITPTTATTSVGGTFQFTAQAYYSNGSVQNGTSLVSWASSNASVATIVTGGLATGLGVGTTTITAAAAGTPGASATLTVNKLTGIAVTPANPTVPLGTNQQFTATGTFSDGTSGNITSTATWTSANAAAATMDTTTTGQADVPTTATAGATSLITATQFGVSGSTTLTVGAAIPVSLQVTTAAPTIAVGNTTAFAVTETWSDTTTGHPPSSAVAWTSGTTATATILPASGIAVGLATGISTITANEPSLRPAPTSGTSTLTVVAGKAHYAYVSNSGPTSNIQSWTVNASTSPYLAPTAQGTFGPGSLAQPLIDPSGSFMYYTDAAASEHVARITPSTGVLTDNGGPSPTVGTTGPYYAVVDPYGRFLFVANVAANAVYGFSFDTSHNLVAITGVAPLTTTSPESLFIDRTGSFLYVVNGTGSATTNGTISTFNIDQTTGALTPPISNATIPTGPEPLQGALDPKGTFLYIANDGNNSVSEYSVGSGGVLTSIGTLTLPASAVHISNVAVDPSGKSAYVLDGGPVSVTNTNGQIFGFHIGSGGVINGSAPISGTPINTGVNPAGGIVIDPTSALIAVDDQNGGSAGSISRYTISAGVLTAVSPVAAGDGPHYVTFYIAP